MTALVVQTEQRTSLFWTQCLAFAMTFSLWMPLIAPLIRWYLNSIRSA